MDERLWYQGGDSRPAPRNTLKLRSTRITEMDAPGRDCLDATDAARIQGQRRSRLKRLKQERERDQ